MDGLEAGNATGGEVTKLKSAAAPERTWLATGTFERLEVELKYALPSKWMSEVVVGAFIKNSADNYVRRGTFEGLNVMPFSDIIDPLYDAARWLDERIPYDNSVAVAVKMEIFPREVHMPLNTPSVRASQPGFFDLLDQYLIHTSELWYELKLTGKFGNYRLLGNIEPWTNQKGKVFEQVVFGDFITK